MCSLKLPVKMPLSLATLSLSFCLISGSDITTLQANAPRCHSRPSPVLSVSASLSLSPSSRHPVARMREVSDTLYTL